MVITNVTIKAGTYCRVLMGWALTILIHLTFVTPMRQVLPLPCPTGQETGLRSCCLGSGGWDSNTGWPDAQIGALSEVSDIRKKRREGLERGGGRTWR